MGLEIRAGVHFGEVEFADGRPAGIIVHTGARVMSVGQAGDVLVTQGVRDLLSGGHLTFTDHGSHELKGVPGIWALFRLTGVDEEPVAPPLDADESASRQREASEPVLLVKRRTFLTGAGAAVVASGSLGAYLLTRKKEREVTPATRFGGNRLFRFDPASGDLEPMPAGLPPLGSILPSLAVGEGGVWVGDTSLHHIDPDSRELVGDIDVGEGATWPVTVIAVALDDIWALTPVGLCRIDPADDEILDRHRFDWRRSWGTGCAIGFESVWICREDGAPVRFEPSEGLPIQDEIPVGEVLSDLVITADAVWVSDEFGTVIRVDPVSDKHRTIKIGGAPKALAATDDRLLAVDPEDRVMSVVNLATFEFHPISLGGKPTAAAVGPDAIWVGDFEGALVELDALLLREVDRTPVPGAVANVAIDPERGWVWLRTVEKAPRHD